MLLLAADPQDAERPQATDSTAWPRRYSRDGDGTDTIPSPSQPPPDPHLPLSDFALDYEFHLSSRVTLTSGQG